MNHLKRLDHLRALAVILVFFYHAGQGYIEPTTKIKGINDFLNIWGTRGSTGVSLFLVLSGFLFCVITEAGQKEINYWKFIQNRILRIFPLMICLVFIVISVGRQDSTPMDILRILTLQLNTGNDVSGWGYKTYPIGPIWTIAVEFQFYLIFPFLILFFYKYGIKNILGILFLVILLRISIVIFCGLPIYWNLYHTILGRLDQFLLGILFGKFYLINKDKLYNKYVLYLILLFEFIGMTILMLFRHDCTWFANTIGFTVEAIIWGLIIYSYLMLGDPKNNFINKILCNLGIISYSVYLLHTPIIFSIAMLAEKYIGFPNQNFYLIKFIISPIIVILIASISYNCIEKPFLLMKVKYLKN